jgi:hypothetical protein
MITGEKLTSRYRFLREREKFAYLVQKFWLLWKTQVQNEVKENSGTHAAG